MTVHFNPLQRISSHFDIKQYSIFRSHLKLPSPYLKVIFRNYKDLTSVPTDFPTLAKKYDEFLWCKMNQTLDEKLQLATGIPAIYINDDRAIECKADVHRAVKAILSQLQKFCFNGRCLYFYSDFQDNATRAASQISRKAIKDKIPVYVISFPDYLEEVKKFENNSDRLKKVNEVELLVLMNIGVEYSTPFSEACLEGLLQKRIQSKKTTIMVSFLEPKDFKKRFGYEPKATQLKFLDKPMTQTLAELVNELEGN